MDNNDVKLDPQWQDLDWAIGQMLLMGFDGTEVTPQIRNLIEEHHLGSILLTAKNLKSAQDTARLVQELQTIAHQAGHQYPLLIAVDQENGGVNSLFDEDYICQFPSAMGVAAAGGPDLAYKVAKATATEVAAVGVNLILGPVLDVLTNARYQPLGVRATSDDPHEVSQYGIAAMKGYRDAGVATCGKHFPSYGNLDFLGSNLDIPIITQTLEELSLSALVPFRNAITTGSLDAMFVGGCGMRNHSMTINHACLSDRVVDDLLRNELGFTGVAISECLEMEALSHEIGVKGGTVMAIEAGCDLVLLCRSYRVQLEAIAGIKLGIENGYVTRERILTSLQRVLRLKKSFTSWAKALNPPGISLLSKIHPSHLELSRRAYDSSITVVRDNDKVLPLTQSMRQEEELLLLTPLVKPLPASAATKDQLKTGKTSEDGATQDPTRRAMMTGEGVFRQLGRSLARARCGKLLHTSYTAAGVRPVHEELVTRASCIIVVTTDANRNLYQMGFTKHVAVLCAMHRASSQKKALVVVAVSSPYDFAVDKTIGTYVCTFDFTETALNALVRVLCGELSPPRGSLPGTLRKSKKMLKAHQQWLVESYDHERDAAALDELLRAISHSSIRGPGGLGYLSATTASSFRLPAHLCAGAAGGGGIEESHFVVRNSSTQALYGFCATYFFHSHGLGAIGALLVDPAKRNVSIGRSLHLRALRSLARHDGIKSLQLGTVLPGAILGTPLEEGGGIKGWFANGGWDVQFPRRMTALAIADVQTWKTPEGLLQSVQHSGIVWDLIHGLDNVESESVLAHIQAHAGPGVLELYRLALQEKTTCGIVRARRGPGHAGTGPLGTVIICSPASPLSTYIPLLTPVKDDDHNNNDNDDGGVGGVDETIGGIIAPVVATNLTEAEPDATLVLQGLALMGLRQNKGHKSTRCVLSWVPEKLYQSLQAMGFEIAQSWEEITNAPENWSDLV